MCNFWCVLYALSIGFRTNSLLVETRVKSTLYTLILYWSGARHWEGDNRAPATGSTTSTFLRMINLKALWGKMCISRDKSINSKHTLMPFGMIPGFDFCNKSSPVVHPQATGWLYSFLALQGHATFESGGTFDETRRSRSKPQGHNRIPHSWSTEGRRVDLSFST